MLKLFQYNWQVREDWFKWCETVPEEELIKERIGGIGSILYTLYHITDVEYSWIVLDMQGKPDPGKSTFETYPGLQEVKDLSRQFNREVEPFVTSWTSEMEFLTFSETDPNGESASYKYGEIMRHVIAHEIHHIGQLSVWAREIDRKPVTANLIRRGLFD